MGAQEKDWDKEAEEARAGALLCVVTVAGIIWLAVYIWRLPPHIGPNYTVAITGVDGLTTINRQDPTTTTALSPVFNLTVRVDNAADEWDRACVPAFSTAVVSYGDAFLGQGSVPPFCAETKEAQERTATAWGQDVVLPRFLRERLGREMERGEAAVDVQVTMPEERCSHNCNDRVLVCSKVKVGGGSPTPSSCRLENYDRRPRPAPAAAASTG